MLKNLDSHQKVNLMLSGLLMVGIVATTFTINTMRTMQSEAAGGTTDGAYCTVDPNTVNLGEPVNIIGAEFKRNESLKLVLSDNTGVVRQTLYTKADSAGNFTVTTQSSWTGIKSLVEVYSDRGKSVLKGTCVFTVN